MAAPFSSPRDSKVLPNGEHGGLFSHLLATNPLWQETSYEMTRHLPPSGAELNVLIINSIGALAHHFGTRRPDLKITSVPFHATSTKIAFAAADNSFDSVAAQSVLRSPEIAQAFLREMLRILRPGGRLILLHPSTNRSMIRLLSPSGFPLLLWKLRFPATAQKALAQTAKTLVGMGYERVLSEQVLRDYGVLSRGEKPYTHLSPVERIAHTASANDDVAQVVEPQDLSTVSRGKFIFLLVKQSPDKPIWVLQPDETLRWQAAMINDVAAGSKPYLLAFTSLPKAVQFMQNAVINGALHGINKVAKFDKSVAPDWAVSLFVNPTFEALQNSEQYTLAGVQLDVDPRRAITGEE